MVFTSTFNCSTRPFACIDPGTVSRELFRTAIGIIFHPRKSITKYYASNNLFDQQSLHEMDYPEPWQNS